MTWHPEDHDRVKHALAPQVLDAAERAGLRVWQVYGSAYVKRRTRDGRRLPAPRHWQWVIAGLSYEIACLLDWDAPPGCMVERAPGATTCLIYTPTWWKVKGETSHDRAAWRKLRSTARSND
jgi:hypothetical protein